MHWSFFDWLARYLSSVIRREGRGWPVGKSRLDREADRVTLGCLVIALLGVGVLVFWVWR